jgi:hypothetical protein
MGESVHGKEKRQRVKKEVVPERRIVVGLKRTDVNIISISEDIQSEEMRS